MTTVRLRKHASNLALAIALATGTAMIAGSVFPTEAHAQRKKKDKKQKQAEYSDAFLKAYQPVDEALKANADIATILPNARALAALAVTPGDKNAAGGLIYNAGLRAKEPAVQLEGMELLLASGKVPPENVGQYNFIAYTLARSVKDYTKGRGYLQAAIDNNYSTETIGQAELNIEMAESHFSTGENLVGLEYLDRAIQARKAQGLAIDEAWYRRGITVAYENEIVPQVYDVSLAWVADFPSTQNWRDAISLARNLNEYEDAEMLDLLRLSREVDALTEKNDYIMYVEAADARLLPKEVKDLIEGGYASGAIGQDDTYIADQLRIANNRVSEDLAALPEIEAVAMADGATYRQVAGAAVAFLSVKQYDKAIAIYQKALPMPGAERDELLTRLGIAQVGSGDYAGAKETFAQVSGSRLAIAKLWAAHASEKGSSAMAEPAAPEVATAGA